MVVAATIIAVVAAAPASAVKFGAPDSADAYPWIGFVVGFDGQGQPLGACSGSLLSGDEFLTAAHCVKDPWPDSPFQPTEMRIWFTNEEITIDPQFYANLEELIADPEAHVDLCADVFGAPCGGYDVTGRPDAHPGWGITTRPQTSDVGMVRDLVWTGDQPPSFGVLAPPAYLDNLAYTRGKGNVQFTVAGFGLQSIRPVVSEITQRMIGTASLVNLRSALSGGWNVQFSNNPGLGHGGSGGTCFGDSGGPLIHDDPHAGPLIVAVNSFGLNHNCQGSNFAYRVDTPYAQDFIHVNP